MRITAQAEVFRHGAHKARRVVLIRARAHDELARAAGGGENGNAQTKGRVALDAVEKLRGVGIEHVLAEDDVGRVAEKQPKSAAVVLQGILSLGHGLRVDAQTHGGLALVVLARAGAALGRDGKPHPGIREVKAQRLNDQKLGNVAVV